MLSSRPRRLLTIYFITALIILVTTHLSMPVYFPLHPDYLFPWKHYVMTLGGAVIILHMVDGIYYLFEKKVFKSRVDVKHIVAFILVSIVTIAVYYSLLYPLMIWLLQIPFDLYSFIISLTSTLVLVALLIFLIYGKKFIELLTAKSIKGNLKVKSGRHLHLIPMLEILCFISQHKTVFLVDAKGKKIQTNFTLNELEGILDKKIFFRANRQFLIQRSSVLSVSPALNDKLEVMLTDQLKLDTPIVVSRYRAVEFKNWLKNN